ncbi:methyltransferase domain-containing protein [Brevundimonas sp.]|uniref:methyltransferase domain-containing protein n=1 Tax=Brevundimonas sp. TaxID=1871086 RepID=UPI0025ED3B17|nr:methyltransferase domain-containing protein [Brevundimonas sp.]
MSAPPRLFDRTLRRRRLERAVRIGLADFLKRRAAESAVQSLLAIMRPFPLGVDLSGSGDLLVQALAGEGAGERVGRLIRADAVRSSGAELVLDEEALPFADESLDLAVSLLSLQWTNDLPGALTQIRRALKPDGLFLGALFGGTTLNELRWALTQAEVEVTGGAGPRISPFADAFDGAALLQRAGFALPVSDLDRVTVRYADPFRLIADLRAMGETGLLTERPRPLTREVLGRMVELYAERFAGPDGRIPATFDIISLTGWAPHPDQQKPLRPGSAKMRLADALGVKEQGAGETPV